MKKHILHLIESAFESMYIALFDCMVKRGLIQCVIAKEINKVVAVYKQISLGVPRSGSGGQAMRRVSASGKLAKASYENNEITSHQQSTGNTHGGRSAMFALNGLLSGNTYSTFFASLMRALFAATSAITGRSITVASPGGSLYTITDGTATWLTSGLKIGDVIRITAGTYANAVNRDNNLIITAVTETVITGATLNGTVMIAEGPIASSAVAVTGKKCKAPLTAHTSDYWTIEEYQSDITKSELFTDAVVQSIDVGIPSTGNTTIAANFVALNRTSSGAQVLTTPTVETTTSVVQGIKGLVLMNGTVIANVTGLNLKIDGKTKPLSNVLGSNFAPDVARGIITVTGQVTAFYQDAIMPGYFDAATPISIAVVDAVDSTNNSEFVSFIMSKVILDGDDKDTGDAGIIRTYPFTAQINGSGGTALANDKTILSIQDSLAS